MAKYQCVVCGRSVIHPVIPKHKNLCNIKPIWLGGDSCGQPGPYCSRKCLSGFCKSVGITLIKNLVTGYRALPPKLYPVCMV